MCRTHSLSIVFSPSIQLLAKRDVLTTIRNRSATVNQVVGKELFVKLRELFQDGHNLTGWLLENEIPLSEDLISLIYDLQAGTYTAFAKSHPNEKERFAAEIASAIQSLPNFEDVSSILDCGTGEATTLMPILDHLTYQGQVLGFDASISRMLWAERNTRNLSNRNLFVAEMSNIPLANRSIDLVLTVHALEPNGGHEQAFICELARISSRYVVLVEPDYSNASTEQKRRMEQLGYVTGVEAAIELASLKVISKLAIESNHNEVNKASMWACEKREIANQKSAQNKGEFKNHPQWIDPIYGGNLFQNDGWLMSREGFCYPLIHGLPLLRQTDCTYFLSPPPPSGDALYYP